MGRYSAGKDLRVRCAIAGHETPGESLTRGEVFHHYDALLLIVAGELSILGMLEVELLDAAQCKLEHEYGLPGRDGRCEAFFAPANAPVSLP
jgi:hypothetical protein